MGDRRWALGVLLVAACGPVIHLPSEGGLAWRELQTEHFTLWTDATQDRGRELAREIEQRRQVILTAMNHTGSRTRAFVIAVRDRIEMRGYWPSDVAVTSWYADNPTGQPGFVMEADDADRRHVVNRALTRLFSAEIVAFQPEWLGAGLARYFETFDVVPGRADAEIGVASVHLRTGAPLHVADLFACEDGCRSSAFDATSWAVFSLLMTHHPDELRRFLHRLGEFQDGMDDDDGQPPIRTSPLGASAREENARKRAQLRQRQRDWVARAWGETFSGLLPEQLDDELADWLSAGMTRLLHIPVTVRDIAITERMLGEADVLAVRGWLGYLFTDDRTAPRRDAEAALALDRTHVLARLIEAAVTQSIAPDDARATASAHPEDWRALRLVESALHGTPEGDEARGRVCSMSANTAPECRRPGRPQDRSAVAPWAW